MGAVEALDPITAAARTMLRLEELLAEPVEDTADTYGMIPMGLPAFLEGLSVCGAPGSLIDLGCGVGAKMHLAWMSGWTVAGVDHREDYVSTARKMCPGAVIERRDALTVDLHGFDVVFSYRLMRADDAQVAFNRAVLAKMRPGALYFCFGSEPDGMIPVGSNVYRKPV